jgi:hypothetical protein
MSRHDAPLPPLAAPSPPAPEPVEMPPATTALIPLDRPIDARYAAFFENASHSHIYV